MKGIEWHSIEYAEVNRMREHYANQNGARAYTMLSPSDVPTHFSIKQSDEVIEITFRYMNESEKIKMIKVLDTAISAKIGKTSKKIYYIKINTHELERYLSEAKNKKRVIRDAAKSKVKETSYSAIKEIYVKYIKDYLISTRAELAF